MFYARMDKTPIGRLLLAGDGERLKFLVFDAPELRHRHGLPLGGWVKDERPFRETIRQLEAYFRGQLNTFDVPLDGDGTAFQQKVWKALQQVPYGCTASYGEIARAIGQPTASRAVGMANGRNPISIIVPCHRIIGSSGRLVGYGGGLDRKQKLLQLEEVAA